MGGQVEGSEGSQIRTPGGKIFPSGNLRRTCAQSRAGMTVLMKLMDLVADLHVFDVCNNL